MSFNFESSSEDVSPSCYSFLSILSFTNVKGILLSLLTELTSEPASHKILTSSMSERISQATINGVDALTLSNSSIPSLPLPLASKVRSSLFYECAFTRSLSVGCISASWQPNKKRCRYFSKASWFKDTYKGSSTM